MLDTMLASGGDERLLVDPRTGRNRYGVPPGSAAGEIWFSSSVAAAASPRGLASAARALDRTIRATDSLSLPGMFDHIREGVVGLFAPQGAEIALAGSGPEAEFILLAAAASLLSNPMTSLVIAPGESDEEFALAANGQHFIQFPPFGAELTRGGKAEGFARDRRSAAIELRDRYGVPLEPAQVDCAVEKHVARALAQGRDVLLHLVDCSQTGRSGPSRACAAKLAAAHPGRVLVAVDIRQLRCQREQIAADLEAGFIVLLSGSHFAGGPPFSGAILFPPAVVEKLGPIPLPAGLAACSAALDWSPRLRDKIEGDFSALANLGLGLRWQCALAELEAYFALDIDTRQRIGARFALELHAHLDASPHLRLLDCDWRESSNARRIFPIVTFDDRGRAFSAEKLHRALAEPHARRGRRSRDERPIHLGAPVAIGPMQALRLSLSAPQVNSVADRLREGMSFDAAFHPLSNDLAETFGRWNELAARDA